jgi:hypothetical protein
MTTTERVIKLLDNKYYYIDNIENKGTPTEYHDIYCGGASVQCINVTFYSNVVESKATLQTVTHDSYCNKNKDLATGANGTVDLTITTLNYIIQTYPNVIGFKLSDFSNKYCENIQFEDALKGRLSDYVNLFYFNIAFNRQTWYQSRFGAILEGTNRTLFEEYLGNFHSPAIKNSVRNINFYNYYIQKIFRGSVDLDQFFRRLQEKYNTAELCKSCGAWIDDLINQYIFNNKGSNFRDDWIIYNGVISRRHVNDEQPILETIKERAKKTTDSYSFEIIEKLEAIKKRREEAQASQAGGSTKQVYLRTLNLDGSTNDIYLGNYSTYKLNIDKYLPEDGHIAVGMLIYK